MIKLSEISTRAPESIDKDEKDKIKAKTAILLEELSDLQYVLYAQSKHSVLILLQGVDAAGKDSTTRHVFSGVNPLGVHVKSWKAPTEEELSHDFLWRIHKHVPAKGMIQVHNRSHYEDVIVPSVHEWFSEEKIMKRYNFINNFESLLIEESNTLVFKFFLHISKKEQIERFEERTQNPKKYWKYNPDDHYVTENWDTFERVYEKMFQHSQTYCPWHIIPADQKWYRDYLVAKEIVGRLKELEMTYPKLER